jgi:hypothetical protein
MKSLLGAVAFVALFALPAGAQPYHPSGNYAHRANALPWDAVVVNGKVVGQDPDPNVRLELRKEAESGQPFD